MLTTISLQQATTPSSDLGAQISAQVRQQVQAQVQAARAEARAARDQARAAREQALHQAQAAPGAPYVLVQPPFPGSGIPHEAVTLGIAFFVMLAVIIVGLPLARAFGRRVDQRGATPKLNPEMAQQLQRIEQAVDAMSIEVERISEAQRYMARLESERRPEPAAVLRPGQSAS
ncbi:MAG TPA: hypothetical protein VFW98_17290 [Gemmatimonadaceae bacterium]|nr:hypothetical protein [Gemmatimonadaceae bacterium]